MAVILYLAAAGKLVAAKTAGKLILNPSKNPCILVVNHHRVKVNQIMGSFALPPSKNSRTHRNMVRV
jgi:hypothetical protein